MVGRKLLSDSRFAYDGATRVMISTDVELDSRLYYVPGPHLCEWEEAPSLCCPCGHFHTTYVVYSSECVPSSAPSPLLTIL